MINIINEIFLLFLLVGMTIVVLSIGLPLLLKEGLDAWFELFNKVKEYKNGRRY